MFLFNAFMSYAFLYSETVYRHRSSFCNFSLGFLCTFPGSDSMPQDQSQQLQLVCGAYFAFWLPSITPCCSADPVTSSLYFSDRQLSLGQSHSSFFCCKSTFLCKSKEENPSTIKNLACPLHSDIP